jgi:hypothetical protein
MDSFHPYSTQTEHSSDPFQIPDNTADRTSSTSEHQLDVKTFHRPSCAYLNPTGASIQDLLGLRRNASSDQQPGDIT